MIRGFTVTLRLAFLGSIFVASTAVAWSAESIHLTSLHPRAEAEMKAARRLINEGSLGAALGRMQRLLDDSTGRNLLVQAGGVPGSRTFEPVTQAVKRFLRKQSVEFRVLYQREHDLTARALYDNALAQRDPRKLASIVERYPLAGIAGRAALGAADFYLEQAQPLRAWRVLDSWEWKDVPEELRQDWAKRMAILSGARSDARARRLWRERCDDDTELPAAAPRERSRKTRLDRLIDTESVELAWSSEAVLRRSVIGSDLLNDVMFSAVPCVGSSWVALPSTRSLDRFELNSGKLLSRDRMPHWTRYSESRAAWRQQPATDGEHLVVSHVAWANPKVGRGYRGGVEKVSLPRRELRVLALHEGGKVDPIWETDGHEDELVRQLSFNSAPVVRGPTVFALGWREMGYVDAYLVAFDIRTGAVLWKTLLVSNQVDLTRFGFMAMEPLLGELLVEDENVYACTNLGACAAVASDDGRIRWLTEYTPVRRLLEIRERRRMSYPYEPQTFWDRCTTVSLDDRLIVAPHDSPAAFAIHKESGRLLQRRRVRGERNFLLGHRNDKVILANQRNIFLVPDHDISKTGIMVSTEGAVRALPALTSEGVVYTTTEGLYYVRFGKPPSTRILADFSIPRGASSDRQPLDGTVTIAGDRILVTSSRHIDCYRFALMERK